MPKNYYIILGIPSKSSQEEIKSAYRRLAKEFHPDRYGDNNSPFLNVQEAYSVLSDPVRRRAYDRITSYNVCYTKLLRPFSKYFCSWQPPLMYNFHML